MARTRQIKPHFLHSTSMSEVSVGAQLTFIRLWLIADDAGRIEDQDWPLYLQVALFPCQDEPKQHVAGWLEELEQVGCIVRYRVAGRPYLRVVNWRKHQRICNATPSKLPAEAEGTREWLSGISPIAREQIESPTVKGPPLQLRTAVLANSGGTPEPFAKAAVEAASGGRLGRFRERLLSKFSFSRGGE